MKKAQPKTPRDPLDVMTKAQLVELVRTQRSVLTENTRRREAAEQHTVRLALKEQERTLVRDAILLRHGMPKEVVDLATKWLCGTLDKAAPSIFHRLDFVSGPTGSAL